MFKWRITKYNPKYRNIDNVYLKNEWTSYSDIGKVFEEIEFTFDQYLKTENAYIAAIVLFMDCLNVTKLHITNIEKYGLSQEKNNYSLDAINAYNKVNNGQYLSRKLIPTIARLALRENIWCKLETKDMFVHFGYDYYMYVGSKKPCQNAIKKLEKLGLFVEHYESPYLNDDSFNI